MKMIPASRLGLGGRFRPFLQMGYNKALLRQAIDQGAERMAVLTRTANGPGAGCLFPEDPRLVGIGKFYAVQIR